MRDPVDRDVVAEVSRDVVGQIAPDELPVFSINSSAYFKNPTKALAAREGTDDALGFGVETVVPMLTPVVIAVVTDVVTHLTDIVSARLASGAEDAAGRGLHALFKSSAGQNAAGIAAGAGTGTAQLTAAQLAEVRSVALEKARQLKLPESQATLLADSLVGRLATASVS